MNNLRIKPMATKAEFEAYLHSVSEKQITCGQASGWQIQQIVVQNTDKLVVDKKALKIRFLGQFDVAIHEMSMLAQDIILKQQMGWFTEGLPPVEYI